MQFSTYYMYDFLIVGSGLFGSVFAHEKIRQGYKVLVLEKAPDVGGMVRTEIRQGIHVHLHGPHIFHTGSVRIWNYVSALTPLRPYNHKVKAIFKGKAFTLPFCLHTYRELWGCETREQAAAELARQRIPIANPANLEEWCLANLGPDLYETLVKGYTKKQWMRDPKQLPASIIQRIPLRMDDNNSYFNHRFQGIPEKGYNHLIEQLLNNVDVRLNADFQDVGNWRKIARTLVYSGPIDELFDYRFGHLEYRSLRFEHETVEGDYQGRALVNYTDEATPFTRIIEHGHFDTNWKAEEVSVITREFPEEWSPGKPRYYPINDQRNDELYAKYKSLVPPDIIGGSRLFDYRYYDMDQVVGRALKMAALKDSDALAQTQSRIPQGKTISRKACGKPSRALRSSDQSSASPL